MRKCCVYNYYNYYGRFIIRYRLKGRLLSDLSAIAGYVAKSKTYVVDR